MIALDALELWVGDLGEASRALSSMLELTPWKIAAVCRPGENVMALGGGTVAFVLRQSSDSGTQVARYVARHGDSIADIDLICPDADALVRRARDYGLKVRQETGNVQIDFLGEGSILHSLRHESIFAAPARPPYSDFYLRTVDHVTYCLPRGTLDPVARIYREVFGLEEVQVEGIRSESSAGPKIDPNGMRSMVLRSSLGFTVVLTEPASSRVSGQIQRFLDAHSGPGVQHVAIESRDLAATAAHLRANGVSFLSVPEDYLERSYQRLHDRDLRIEDLRRGNILADADANGLLFQTFTRPLTRNASFFIELIERAGATGFGSANVRALYAAVDNALRDPDQPLWPPPAGTSSEPGLPLNEMVHWSRTQIPFYREHLNGIAASDLSALRSFDKSMIRDFGRFPISAGGAPGAHRVLATSGTSGKRMYVCFDKGEWDRTGDWLENVGRRTGLTSEDVLLNTHCYGLWVGGPALDLLATRVGAGLIPVGATGFTEVLELLSDGVGSAISATPSYLCGLIEAAREEGVDLRQSPLRLGFIGAECAEESLRQKLRIFLPEGFQWIELYGLTETGGPSVAFAPDPVVPELELNTRDFCFEVLDSAEDLAVPPGEVGELTITTRRINGRTPLLRYRTRDLVRVTAGSPATPARISRILGRVDEAHKVGGVLIYPTAISGIMAEFLPPSTEWRAWVRPKDPDNELVIEAEASSELCEAAKRAFEDRIGVDLTLTPTPAGRLSRSYQKSRRVLTGASAIDPRQ
jgi:4-hydroxyphenylpyruvate dioxygenase